MSVWFYAGDEFSQLLQRLSRTQRREGFGDLR